METPHGVISAFFTGFAVKLAMDGKKNILFRTSITTTPKVLLGGDFNGP